MRTITESQNYNAVKPDTVAYSTAVDLLYLKSCMIGCFIKIKNNAWKLFLNWPLKVRELISARDVSNHISTPPVPALFLAYRAITRLEKTHSRERGGLILSLMQPQQQQDITLTC